MKSRYLKEGDQTMAKSFEKLLTTYQVGLMNLNLILYVI